VSLEQPALPVYKDRQVSRVRKARKDHPVSPARRGRKVPQALLVPLVRKEFRDRKALLDLQVPLVRKGPQAYKDRRVIKAFKDHLGLLESPEQRVRKVLLVFKDLPVKSVHRESKDPLV
jgi:hypothetical protein